MWGPECKMCTQCVRLRTIHPIARRQFLYVWQERGPLTSLGMHFYRVSSVDPTFRARPGTHYQQQRASHTQRAGQRAILT
jgi:hypothetical protein